MGLKISTYKVNGNTFNDAYAKVDSIRYDNNTKVASFDVAVYPTKGDNNLIEKAVSNWAKINAGEDMTAQCYVKLAAHVLQLQSQVAAIETAIAGLEDGAEKTRKEFELRRLKSMKALQLAGTEW